MYGLFYARKNNNINVLFMFQSKSHKTAPASEVQITDWRSVKHFNENVKKAIESKTKELFDSSYKIYYRVIPDNKNLKTTMKELNINNSDINNPLINITNFDIEVGNITNIKMKKYDKY